MTSVFNQDKQVLYVDSPINRTLTANGALAWTTNSKAVMTAFSMWLASGPQEQRRNAGGGYVLPYIYKPLTTENASDIYRSILSGLKNDFTPVLTVVSLSVVPDRINRQWVILLVAYNSALNIGINDVTYLDNPSG
jgi:hypothetical protein